jgi:perosamine synthetase
VVRIDIESNHLDRGMVFRQLREAGIGVNVHYIPVYLHPYYRLIFKTTSGQCPVAEDAYTKILSLPIYPKMSDQDVAKVIDSFLQVVNL